MPAGVAGRRVLKARRRPPAAAAGRVSGTSHADDGVTSHAARTTGHTHARDTTSLAARRLSTDGRVAASAASDAPPVRGHYPSQLP